MGDLIAEVAVLDVEIECCWPGGGLEQLGELGEKRAREIVIAGEVKAAPAITVPGGLRVNGEGRVSGKAGEDGLIVAAVSGAFVEGAQITEGETANHAAARAPGGGRDVEFGVEGLVGGGDVEGLPALGAG